MSEMEMNRRLLLKHSAGVMALAIGGGTAILVVAGSLCAGLRSRHRSSCAPSAFRSPSRSRSLDDFRKESGVGQTSGTAATFPDAQTKILSGSKDYDCWGDHRRAPAVDRHDQQCRANSSRLLEELGQHPRRLHDAVQTSGGAEAADRRADLGRRCQNRAEHGSPQSITTIPSVIIRTCCRPRRPTAGLQSLIRSGSGQVGSQHRSAHRFGRGYLLAMNTLGLSSVKRSRQLRSAAEIDEAAKFLVSKKKDGQFARCCGTISASWST